MCAYRSNQLAPGVSTSLLMLSAGDVQQGCPVRLTSDQAVEYTRVPTYSTMYLVTQVSVDMILGYLVPEAYSFY